jgi:predicted RNA-binding protein with EMAP domain
MVKIGISIGELIDKITILRIKSKFTDSPYVKKELEDLKKIASTLDYSISDESLLYEINQELWNVEDLLRQKEKQQDFGNEFIALARSVYYLNDKRADIKRKINDECDSYYKEIKCY